MRTFFYLILTVAILSGCGIQKKVVTVKYDSKNQYLPVEATEIVGQVATVLPVVEQFPKRLPAGNNPSVANVKILKVITTGDAFKPVLLQNQEVKINFAYTLAATDSIFPKSQKQLPGLSSGDMFRAHVRIIGRDKQGRNIFEVSEYEKL